MTRRFAVVLALLCSSPLVMVQTVFAQLPPLVVRPLPPPVGQALGLPPLGGAAGLPPLGAAHAAPAGGLSVEGINNDLKAARAANQEKRFADAETLMLKDTATRHDQPYLWIELGLAQMGQKKYEEAEVSFNTALYGGDSAQTKAPSGSFYTADGRTASNTAGGTVTRPANLKSKAEIDGLSLSNLGEIYIHTNRVPEAKTAYDEAVKANPSQAGLYLRNEAIFFLQAGKAVEQVEAANKAIAVDPTRAALYFYKGQGLAAQATIDASTQKLILPAGCAEALQKYLDLDTSGPYAADAKGMLSAAGVPLKPGK